jgi:protein TonB
MNAAVLSSPRYDPTKILAVTLAVSFGLHAAYLLTLSGRVKGFVDNTPIEMSIIETVKPPPPPPEEKKEPPKPKPPPIARINKPQPPEPPKPNQEAPKEPPKPVPVVIGIQMESTTATGGFAAPVGNSNMGAMPKQAPDPNAVQPYKAPKYVPPGGADTDPVPENEVKIPYPESARAAQIEGTVQLRIVVDADGHVVDIRVISGPGYGLDEAAREALKRFKFRPAMKGGEAVSTAITYKYTFILND